MSGENKRYYWLKLKDDFFRQKEIKQLRRIAGGDTFTIVYLKMLLRSLKDDGKLYYEGIEQDFVSELALDIDEDEDNVKVTVSFLMAKGLLIQSIQRNVCAGCATESCLRHNVTRLLQTVTALLQTVTKRKEKREKRQERRVRLYPLTLTF